MMKKLLNTLYITSSGKYLSLDGENAVVLEDGKEIERFPLHNFEAIVTAGYTGCSPAFMGACSKKSIALSFLTPSGRFLARVCGLNRGNVLLRRTQYRLADDPVMTRDIAKGFLCGKIYNCRQVIQRAVRDYPMRLDTCSLKDISAKLRKSMQGVVKSDTTEELRGFEGEAAKWYFSGLDDLVLNQKESFTFTNRNRRPPTDNFNALLSFVYTLLAENCAASLEAVGLDAYVGYLHRDKPGRASLALDLMEELRPILADRFILSLINKKLVSGDGFIKSQSGSVLMTDKTRRKVIREWQSRKGNEIRHPYLEEKVEWGLVPYVQSLLLARFLRGDIDAYPPFFWK